MLNAHIEAMYILMCSYDWLLQHLQPIAMGEKRNWMVTSVQIKISLLQLGNVFT